MSSLPEGYSNTDTPSTCPNGEACTLAALKERIFWLESVIDGTGAGTWEWNVQTGETRFNERWADIIGYQLQELQPTTIDTWMHFAHPDDLAESEKKLARHLAGDVPFYACDARMRHRDGHWVWVRDHGRVVTRSADGDPQWMTGSHIDITEQKYLIDELTRALNDAHELTQQLERAQIIGRLGYWRVNLSSGELFWSSMVYQIFGVDPATFQPTMDAFRAAVHPDDREKVKASEQTAYRSGVHDVIHRIVRPDGEVRWVHELADFMPQGCEQLLMGTVRDITEEKRQELRLRQLSCTDSLTGLFNRRHFMKSMTRGLEHIKRSGCSYALIMLDFDHFKYVNDTYGHVAGDKMLETMGELLSRRLRVNDLPARLGGEEFAVLLPDTIRTDAARIAEEICEKVAALEFSSGNTCFSVSVTCGISMLLPSDAGVEDVMHRADHNLYHGKHNGRNCVVSDPGDDMAPTGLFIIR